MRGGVVWMAQNMKHDQGHAQLDPTLECAHEASRQLAGSSQGVLDCVIRYGGDCLPDFQFS